VIGTDAYVVDAGVGSSDLAQVRKGLQSEVTPTGLYAGGAASVVIVNRPRTC